MRWLMRLYYWHQRQFDLAVLWPSCRKQASSLDYARAAFALHALHDTAWLELGEQELIRRIDALN